MNVRICSRSGWSDYAAVFHPFSQALVVQRILSKIDDGMIDPNCMISGILAENRRTHAKDPDEIQGERGVCTMCSRGRCV